MGSRSGEILCCDAFPYDFMLHADFFPHNKPSRQTFPTHFPPSRPRSTHLALTAVPRLRSAQDSPAVISASGGWSTPGSFVRIFGSGPGWPNPSLEFVIDFPADGHGPSLRPATVGGVQMDIVE